jgi:hypothetical protein
MIQALRPRFNTPLLTIPFSAHRVAVKLAAINEHGDKSPCPQAKKYPKLLPSIEPP